MASRRRARGFALQALYHSDLTDSAVQRALTDLWAGLLDGEGFDVVDGQRRRQLGRASAVRANKKPEFATADDVLGR